MIEFIQNNPRVKVVGLSGSPFTKGLANTYTSVVSAITVNELVERGLLIQPRIFIAKQIDMAGAKKIGGEWSDKEATERGDDDGCVAAVGRAAQSGGARR